MYDSAHNKHDLPQYSATPDGCLVLPSTHYTPLTSHTQHTHRPWCCPGSTGRPAHHALSSYHPTGITNSHFTPTSSLTSTSHPTPPNTDLLRQYPGAHPPQLLHVPAHPQQQSHVYTQSADVRTSLTAHPEHSCGGEGRVRGGCVGCVHAVEWGVVTAVRWACALTHVPLGVVLNHLALVDGPDAKLALDSCNERWALEQGSGQGLQGLWQGWTQTMDRLQTGC